MIDQIRKQIIEVQLISLNARLDEAELGEFSDHIDIIKERDLLHAQIVALKKEINVMGGLRESIAILKKTIDKQEEFIKWLESKGLYEPMENTVTMNKMYKVWEALKEENK